MNKIMDNFSSSGQVPLTEGLRKLKLKLQSKKSNSKEGVDLAGIAKKLSAKKFAK